MGRPESWVVRCPEESALMRRFKSGVGTSGGTVLQSGADDSLNQQVDPSEAILDGRDLSLSDNCPFALIEHIEQYPILINNPGMVGQIVRHYRPGRESVTATQAEKKYIKGRLGPFGPVRIVSDSLPMFGGQMRMKYGQGAAILYTKLYEAQVFSHPVDSKRKLDSMKRFHDYRSTDFLLIRVPSDGGRTKVFLRAVYFDPPSDNAGIDGMEMSGNRAGVGVYTVGQLQPQIEIPAPEAKRTQDLRKEQMRAFAYRLAAMGVTDFYKIRESCIEVFQRIFEPSFIIKNLKLFVRFQDSNSVAVSVLEEQAIRDIITPELVAVLDMVAAGEHRLRLNGLRTLRSIEKVPAAVAQIEKDEYDVALHLRKAKDRVADLNRLLTDFDSKTQVKQKNKYGDPLSLFSLIESTLKKRLTPIVRVAEEMLLLTPWNLTREHFEVVKRNHGQFSLEGIGDPSGGRGEGLNFIRSHRRDRDIAYENTATPANNQQSSKGDLRKLSMSQLRECLTKFGFDEPTIRSLPRWDQVALVRRLQTETGSCETPSISNIAASPISAEDYHAKLNAIFMKQRKALEPDEPEMTPSESEDEDMKKNSSMEDDLLSDIAPNSAAKSNVGVDTKAVTMDDMLEDSLEDALVSGLDKQKEAHVDAETMEQQQYDDFLKQLERGQEAKSSAERQHVQRMKLTPVPRIKWARYTRSQNGTWAEEKVVYIYGEENIKRFQEWRARRVATKRRKETFQAQGVLGTATRTCRKCGQMGHISSNPICPQYDREKKIKAPSTVKRRQTTNGSLFAPQTDKNQALNDELYDTRHSGSDVGARDTHRRRREHDGECAQPQQKVQRSIRMTARQRAMTGTPAAADFNTADDARRQLNHIIWRVLSKMKERKWAAFWDKVDEAFAPRYYSIIDNPIWLSKMAGAARSQAYKSVDEFVADINLLANNCLKYNSAPGHWLRPLAEELREKLRCDIEKNPDVALIETYLVSHGGETESM